MLACVGNGTWGMWLGGLVFWGALLGFGVWAVRRVSASTGSSGAMRVLEERFARGEVTAEEFASRSRILEGADR